MTCKNEFTSLLVSSLKHPVDCLATNVSRSASGLLSRVEAFGLLIYYDESNPVAQKSISVSLSAIDDYGIINISEPHSKIFEAFFLERLASRPVHDWHPGLMSVIQDQRKKSKFICFQGSLVLVRGIDHLWRAVISFVTDGHHLKSSPADWVLINERTPQLAMPS